MMMMMPVRVLSLLSLSILILHAYSFQGENVEVARSNYKESIMKENGVIIGSRKMMMLNYRFKKRVGFETNSMNVEGGTRKLQGMMNTLHVKEEHDNVGNLVPEEKDNSNNNMGGYVAFSADYRGPRHHPPKNN